MGPKNNIDAGVPSSLNLIFANQFKWAPTMVFKWPQFKWAPNNNIVPGGPSHLKSIFASQFKNALYNNI